jgi:hypothetical protein
MIGEAGMTEYEKRTSGLMNGFVAGMAIGCLAGIPWWHALNTHINHLWNMIPEWPAQNETERLVFSAPTIALLWALLWGAGGTVAAKLGRGKGIVLLLFGAGNGMATSLLLAGNDPWFAMAILFCSGSGTLLCGAVALNTGRTIP